MVNISCRDFQGEVQELSRVWRHIIRAEAGNPVRALLLKLPSEHHQHYEACPECRAFLERLAQDQSSRQRLLPT